MRVKLSNRTQEENITRLIFMMFGAKINYSPRNGICIIDFFFVSFTVLNSQYCLKYGIDHMVNDPLKPPLDIQQIKLCPVSTVSKQNIYIVLSETTASSFCIGSFFCLCPFRAISFCYTFRFSLESCPILRARKNATKRLN